MRKMGVFAEIIIRTIYQVNLLNLQEPRRKTYYRFGLVKLHGLCPKKTTKATEILNHQ